MMTGIMIATYPNVVSENLYSQVDSEVYQFLLLEEISDHRSDGTAIAVADGFIISRGGKKTSKENNAWVGVTRPN